MTAGVGSAVTSVRPRARWDVFRWLLLGAWVVIMIVGVARTSRSSTFDALKADLDGGVDRVTVAGQGAPLSGDAVQEVRWRSGSVNHKVQVHVVAPEDPSQEGDDSSSDDSFSTDGGFSTDGLEQVDGLDVGDVLTAQHAGLKVTRTGLDEDRARAGTTIRVGFRVTTPFDGGAGLAAAAHLLLSVVLIIFGPQPWRATRWAWFWLLGIPYIGLPAMLILSGPTRGVPPPRSARRLTGGKAFLIAVVTFSLASLLVRV